MPYIIQEKRKKFAYVLNELNNITFENKGELEYILYAILKEYMKNRKFCYTELHDTVYGCQHVSDEFRRNYLDVRENEAKEKNGDI
jgi:hypothetical protein